MVPNMKRISFEFSTDFLQAQSKPMPQERRSVTRQIRDLLTMEEKKHLKQIAPSSFGRRVSHGLQGA
jgi:hypothetical protein